MDENINKSSESDLPPSPKCLSTTNELEFETGGPSSNKEQPLITSNPSKDSEPDVHSTTLDKSEEEESNNGMCTKGKSVEVSDAVASNDIFVLDDLSSNDNAKNKDVDTVSSDNRQQACPNESGVANLVHSQQVLEINEDKMETSESDSAVQQLHSADVDSINESVDHPKSLLQNNFEQSVRKDVERFRCEPDSSSLDSDSSTSDSSSDSSDFFQLVVESSGPKKLPVIKTKGELGLDDLPPIEDLTISLKEEEMLKIGIIHAIVDKLVVIHAVKDMKALDLDSVLFLSHDKPLGHIFDVFGPVDHPFYCVRFNSADHIDEKGIEIGANVFFAPEKRDITSYVFVDELQREKGSDASWKDNNEPPEQCLDFSDDEQEKVARRKRMTKNRNQQFSSNSDVAPKRSNVSGDSSFQSNNRPGKRHTSPQNDIQVLSVSFPRSNSTPQPSYRPRVWQTSPRNSNGQFQRSSFSRRNPFSTPPLPPPSPTPSLCSVMSIPIRTQNAFNFQNVRQPRVPFSLQRSASPLLLASYQQPHVFGQVPLLSPRTISPLQSPSILHAAAPTFVSPPATRENYFHPGFNRNPPTSSQANFSMVNPQRFPRGSPVYHNQRRVLPDPWLRNRNEPYNAPQVPPDHPLTIQIPNVNTSPPPMNLFNRNGFY